MRPVPQVRPCPRGEPAAWPSDSCASPLGTIEPPAPDPPVPPGRCGTSASHPLGRRNGNSQHFAGRGRVNGQGVLQSRGHEFPEPGKALGVPGTELVDLPPVAVLQRGQHLLLGNRGGGKLSTEEDQQLRGTPQAKALLAELAGVALPSSQRPNQALDGLPALAVEVVLGHGLHGLHLVAGAQEAIDALDRREFHPRVSRVQSPEAETISSGREPSRPRSPCCWCRAGGWPGSRR